MGVCLRVYVCLRVWVGECMFEGVGGWVYV